MERKQLMDSLEEKDARIEELEAEVASSITMSDEEFMAKASYFILSQQLQDKRFVDYEKFIRKIDPQIVKDFLNSVVTNFCIKNGLTASILFKNGVPETAWLLGFPAFRWQYSFQVSDKHRIPETEKAILFSNSCSICLHRMFITCKRTD